MKKFINLFALALLFLFSQPLTSHAQIDIGVRGGAGFGGDDAIEDLFVGVGLTYVDVELPGDFFDESTTDFGVNLLIGLYLGTGQLRPYAQVRTKLFGDIEMNTAAASVLYRF